MKMLNRVKLSKQTLLAMVLGFALFNTVLYLQLDPRVSKMRANSEELLNIFDSIYHRHEALKHLRTRSEVYNEIFSEINMIDLLATLYSDRCLVYFNHLSKSAPDWIIDPHENLEVLRAAYDTYERYRESTLRKWKEDVEKAKSEGHSVPKEPNDDKMREEYERIVRDRDTKEQILHDYTAHVRVFDRCYLEGYSPENGQSKMKFVDEQNAFLNRNINYQASSVEVSERKTILKEPVRCSSIERKIFPFISGQYPLFTRWDDTVHFFPNSDHAKFPSKDCFLNDFQKRINGRGIVLTLGDGRTDDAARLIRTLRYLQNPYPIQVVYHLGLSDELIERLKLVCRDYYHGFPAQDIWFVNVKRSINEKFLNKFQGFSNKILAMIFNSFEEILFLDADAATLKDPDFYFSLKGYVETGTYFYRDRALGQGRPMYDIKFFRKILPSIEDSVVFNIDQTNNYTLGNGFFNGMAYYMESGVVVLNRKTHFIQPLMMSVISFYHPVYHRIWGDKEMFWLAVAVSGNNNYHFNEVPAVAAGEFIPAFENSNPNMKSKKLCSAHPAHLSGEDLKTLVWINSGFRFCSKSANSDFDLKAEYEKGRMFTWHDSFEAFLNFYTSPLVVKDVLIPPYTKAGRLENDEDEPLDFWVMTDYCSGYMWCSFSHVGGQTTKGGKTVDNSIEGQIIELDDVQIARFAKVASYWVEDLPWLKEDRLKNEQNKGKREKKVPAKLNAQ